MSFQKFKTVFEKRTAETIVLVGLIALVAVATQASGDILDSGSSSELVAEYRFDTGAGETVYDSSDEDEGLLEGSVRWASGIRENSVKFDGTDGRVNLGSDGDVTGDQITISFWSYWKDAGDQDHPIISKNPSSDWEPGNGYVVGTGWGDDFRVGIGPNLVKVGSQSGIKEDKWQHYTVTYEEGVGMKLYLNGKLQFEDTSFSGNVGHTDQELWIGDAVRGGNWKGRIDNVKIYRKAINKSQAKSLYNSGSWRIGADTKDNDPSKVLDVSFQHQNSSHVLDNSGYNNHGERLNGVGQETSVGCKVGRCYSFDGSDDYVEVSSPSDPATTGETNSFTTMFWLNPESGSGTNALVEWDGAAHVWQYNSEDDFFLNPKGSCNSREATGEIKLDQWSHYAVLYDAPENEFRWYVDGRLVKSAIEDCSPDTSSDILRIGRRTGDSRVLEGEIDQVMIFNRSLSQQEIIEKTQGLEGGGTSLDLRFNREGGDKVHDFSSVENHGILQPDESAGPERVGGLTGKALQFDGSNYVDISSGDSAYDSNATTVSAWVKPDSGGWVVGNGARHRLNVDNDAYWWIRERTTGSSHTIQGGQIKDNQWNYVVGTYDSSTGMQKLYVNGDKVAEQNVGEPIKEGHDNQIVGGSYGSNADFDGSIDNLKIYPYSVSEDKIKQYYKTGKSFISSSSDLNQDEKLQTGLVLSQTFDRAETCGQSDTISCLSGMSGEVSVDESGEANHGELVNGPTEKNANDCKVGGCLGFDGSNDYVETNEFSISGTQPRTISTWYNTEKDSTWYQNNQQWAAMVDFPERESNEGSFMLVPSSGECSNNDIAIHMWGSNTCSGKTVEEVGLGEWHHLVGVMTGNGKQRIYIDGKLEGISSFNPNTTSGPIQIGRRSYSNKYYFNGKLDQVRIYNRSLTNGEVWKLYTRGRDRDPESEKAGPVAHYRFNGDNSKNLAPNPSFSSGGGPPYKWVQQRGSSSVVDHSRGDIRTGSKAIEFPGDGNYHRIRSQTFSVTPGEEIYGRCYTKSNSGGDFYFGLDWIGAGWSYFDHPETNSWTLTDNTAVTVPEGVNKAGVWLFNYKNNSGKVWADDCIVSRSPIGNTTEELTVPSGYDASGEDNQGVSYGTAITDGKVGESLHFDGTDSRFEIGETIDYSKDSVTVGAWIKQTGTASSYYQRVTDGGLTYWVDDRSGDTCVRLTADEGGNSAQTCFNTGLDKNEWHHLLFTYDSSTSETKLYVDGKLFGTSSYYSGDMTGYTNSLAIGNNAGGSRPWKGQIDDVRIYPYALNEDQVKEVANQGSATVG